MSTATMSRATTQATKERAPRRRATLLLLAALGCALAGWYPSSVAAQNPQRTLEVVPATDLENQVVRLSWSGFPPSVDGANLVWVFQCKDNPSSLADCYQKYRPPGGVEEGTAFFDGVTDEFGNGSDVIEVRPALDLPELDCSASNPCSIVAFEVGEVPIPEDALPDWAVVEPLAFAPSPADCPSVSTFDVRTEGEASAAHALYSWSAETCTDAEPLTVDYTESSADAGRRSFLAGDVDVGVVTRAADPQAAAARPAAYAPIDVSAVVIAFNAIDTVTGQPIREMKLTPRLVALLIAGNNPPLGPGAHLTQDPEFVALNPGHTWPINTPPPLLRAERNDDTYLLTRWLQEDPAARRYLDGNEPGVPVDPFWKNVVYPTDLFEARNEGTIGSYNPRVGTTVNTRRLFNFLPPGDTTISPFFEGVIGIMDLVTAEKFGLPIAQIVPADGSGAAAVAPNSASLEAGVAAMVADASGTLRTDVKARNGAYPLVKVDYAMVPTSGLDATKARNIESFLEYAAGPGQAPGALPQGYLPLTEALRDQNATARAAVLAGVSTPSPTSPAPTDPGSTDFGGAPTDFGGSSSFEDFSSGFDDFGVSSDDALVVVPAGSDGDSGGAEGSADADTELLSARFLGSQGNLVLPVLLAMGLAALVAGPTALLLLTRRPKPPPAPLPTDP